MVVSLFSFCASWAQTGISDTFTNPVINADVPDMALTRVGDDYYMVSTTMHLMPGAPIMKSKDLVNWHTIGYIFDKLTDTPNYFLDGCTAYGRGQWATSLRYHNGKFYAFFSPNDKPWKGYIYSTTDPSGKWELVSRIPHFHDSSLFFDDDGKVYMFYGTGMLKQLKSDLTDVEPGGVDMKIFERDSEENALLEGSQVIKHNGKYYLLMISWPRGQVRRQVCYRADKITGPYEKKVILDTKFDSYGGVGQGCLIDTPQGNWYAMLFQDRGAVGRTPCLMPCTWVDGWPMLGNEKGEVDLKMKKPFVLDEKITDIISSDEFDSSKMNINWQWNHNPVDNAWSLAERPGYLRLKTSRVVDNLYAAPNTLTQRMGGPKCSGTVLIDIKNMKDGDVAGFSAFNGHSGTLSIKNKNGVKFLVMNTSVVNLRDEDKAIVGVEIAEKEVVKLDKDLIYLRIDADLSNHQDMATFYYSLDNKEWKPIGEPFKMLFDYTKFFMGSKFAIFNYATKSIGGYIDVDNFTYKN